MSKILIIDDERLVIEQVSKMLSGYGYEYDFISKPKFLYQKLDNEKFELILLDINMEGEDGITILKNLKENEKYKHLTIIMMTGEANQSIISQCFELGASDYVIKPIRELEFKARIKSIMKLQEYISKVEKQKEELRKNQNTIMKSLKKVELQNKVIARKNSAISASIKSAERIQNAILPSIEEIQSVIPEIFILFKPRDIVSGDFYWYRKIHSENGKDEKYILVVADCTGHGVPGAFMSALGTTLIKEIITGTRIISPSEILTSLNKKLTGIFIHEREEESIKDGMEIGICLIDPEKQMIHFSGAKRPLICIDEKGDISIHKSCNLSIGIQSKNRVPHCKNIGLKINPKTTYYMFSDGYQDQFNHENNKRYTKRKVLNFLAQNKNYSLKKQEELLRNELDAWKGENRQTDDILIMGFSLR